MNAPTDTAVTWTADLPTTVRLVRTLHDLGPCWTRTDVERLVADRPDWKIRREFADLLVVGLQAELRWPLGAELYLGTTVPKATTYRRARLQLLEFRLPVPEEERRTALRTLAEALRGIGSPTAVPTAADGFGLRWRSAERTMLFQANDRRAWIAVQPLVRDAEHISPELPAVIAAFAPALHDSPGGRLTRADIERAAADERAVTEGSVTEQVGAAEQAVTERAVTEGSVTGQPRWSVEFVEARAEIHTPDPDCTPRFIRFGGPADTFRLLQLHRFEEEPALERRRAVFGEIHRAVCGVLGEPTLFGGGPDGPDVRWREAGDDPRLLRLRADRRSVWLETAPAEEVEEEEYGTFEHGGPIEGPDGPSGFPRLPYSWQLHVFGAPGDLAGYLPGGRLALSLPHLREGLESLLAAWIEQLPVQRPGEKVTFTLASPLISGGIAFTYDTVKGILLRVGPRPGEATETAAAMAADGWQASGSRFKAQYKVPTEATAGEVATLITTELAARGITGGSALGLGQGRLTARRVGIGTPTHGAQGFFRVTGLGLETS
ncbi:hypothetical protein [Kitasatospora sp. NBC_00458]|uniref:hypothetical protein n=1 Tax=Kitasatospora sp. NBC_00458 TaxID=2903568 RepID=UPI002E17E164